MKIRAKDFEEKVQKVEDVVIRLRCSRDDLVEDYEFERKAPGNTSVSDWTESRINSRIGNFDFDIIEGRTYQKPHGRTNMDTLRKSYEK